MADVYVVGGGTVSEPICDGGVQIVPPQIAGNQLIYLDFDGELTRYDGEILTVETVEVEDSRLTPERIAAIAAALNGRFADLNVRFVTERPLDADYSTVYVGKTSAFDPYGHFTGLAETVDSCNGNRNDNAFVMLDSDNTDDEIINTVTHEICHLLGTLDHGGDGIIRYADDEEGYIYYYYYNNHVYTGTLNSSSILQHYDSAVTIFSSQYQSSGGNCYVCAGSRYDRANFVTVYGGGAMTISSGGTATNTTVHGGRMSIGSGGVAKNTIVEYYSYNGVGHQGSIYVYSGGTATFITVSSFASAYILNGATANRIIANVSGHVYIQSGGKALQVVENGGCVDVAAGANVTFASNTFHDLIVLDPQLPATVHSGTTAFHNTIYTSLTVYSGGVAIGNQTAHDFAHIVISRGGMADSTFLYSGGSMVVSSGGTAIRTTVNVGELTVSSGGTATRTTIYCSGLTVSSGGTAIQTTVNSWGSLTLSSAMVVCNGGTAIQTTVNSWGGLTVFSGGTALEIVENGGYVGVYAGANVTFVANTFSGLVLSYGGSATVHSGTTATDTTVNAGGRLSIFSGGIASNTTVNAGGSMYVYSGGIASNTTVSRVGYLYVGGVHRGTLQIASGGVVSAYSGSVVEMDLAGRTSRASAIINDISRIGGSPTYTVTVSADKTRGVYKLAGNAANFTRDVNLTVHGGGTGKFSYADGKYNTVQLGDEIYRLVVDSSGDLCLKIGAGNMSINYSVDEVGQIVYYDGPTEKQFSGAVMKVPYLASAEITMDKDIPDGEYSFVTSLAEVEGTEECFKIQVIDGTPSYVSLNPYSNACYYGTKISETSGTVTWRINGISDYVLTDRILSEMTLAPRYGSLSVGTGMLLVAGVSLLVGCSTEKIVKPKDGDADANKDGYYITLGVDYNDDKGNKICHIWLSSGEDDHDHSDVSITVDYHDGNAKQANITIPVIKCADLSQTQTVTISAEQSGLGYGLQFSFVPKDNEFGKLYKILPSGKKELISEKYTITSGNSEGKHGIGASLHHKQTYHCWVAAATNMLFKGGYLETSDYQACFDYLSRYYYGIGRKGMDSIDTVFKDLGVVDVAKGIMPYRNWKSNVTGALDHMCGNSGAVGAIMIEPDGSSHGITCLEVVKFDANKRTAKVRYSDSDTGLGKLTVVETKLEVRNGKWCIHYNGSWHEITGFETLLPHTSGTDKVYYTDIKHIEVSSNIYGNSYSNVTLYGSLAVVNDFITDAVIEADGILEIAAGASAEKLTILGDGAAKLDSGAAVGGEIRSYGGVISVESGVEFTEASFNFVISGMSGGDAVMLDNIRNAAGAEFSVTLVDDQAAGRYALAGNATGFSGEITVIGELGDSYALKPGFALGELGNLTEGDSIRIGNQIYSLSVTDDILYFDVEFAPLSILSVEPDTNCFAPAPVTVTAVFSDDIVAPEFSFDGENWEAYSGGVTMTENGSIYFRGADAEGNLSEVVGYEVCNITTVFNGGDQDGITLPHSDVMREMEISLDDFESGLLLTVDGSRLDIYGMPDGCCSWRFAAIDADEWSYGNDIAVAHNAGNEVFQSAENGASDLFFAQSSAKWGVFAAQHTGTLDGWSGTGEQIYLRGKNRIADVFAGSTDANILVLTDDANGDALFVDDIYTALPDGLSDQARISQIKEIRAGVGDDIVDLTSQQFAYTNGLTVYGGLGDDTIWANTGSNQLFGDAGNDRIIGAAGDDLIVGGIGNDRMHGGGGNDLFTFCSDWGTDTVEQLAGGTVTLWFASGSMDNWDASTLTYIDGANSVTVSGITAENITLKFGDASPDYAALSAAGAFTFAASEKIFEDPTRGMIA